MISLPFRVNSSFRKHVTHPITIPRGIVEYHKVDRITAGAISMKLVFPNGGVIPAKICSGQAGFGEYRQNSIA